MRSLVVILAALTLVSCNRDPNVAKKRYLENGNKYFAKGKYKEASIMYRNALQKDQRYGPAYYRLAQTDLKLGRIPNALGELRRAIELIPKDQPDHLDAEVRLAEIYLAFTRESQFLAEVEGITKELLRRDPNSYDGHRLTADLNFVRAQAELPRRPPRANRKAADHGHRRIPQGRCPLSRPGPLCGCSWPARLAAHSHIRESEQIYQPAYCRRQNPAQAYNELYGVLSIAEQNCRTRSRFLRREPPTIPSRFLF